MNLRKLPYLIFFKTPCFFLAKVVGIFFPSPRIPERDTSWEVNRDRLFSYGINFWVDQLDRLGLKFSGGTLLEIGSGNGQWLLAAATRAETVIGIEPWTPIRQYSQKKMNEFPEELTKKISIINASAEQIPLPDQSVDSLLCAGVFMFTNQAVALREMKRVLKPGGIACITVVGLGYFINDIISGFQYKSTAKMERGVSGLLRTFSKWISGSNALTPRNSANGATAVSYKEMSSCLQLSGFKLLDARIWTAQSNYPEEVLGFVSNYAFLFSRL